jgi:hypothetical protein
MIVYEQLLNQDVERALQEGSLHFETANVVHLSLHTIVARLQDLGVPFVVAGGMALFLHGYRRFTEDVNILVTPEGLRLIHERLEGLGYVPPFAESKQLRDAETGVRIEFLTARDYPGDGKPKPVAFPDPAAVRVEKDGIAVLSLPSLIELKLASGLTNPLRLRDIADVQELIQLLKLPASLADQLNPFVRDKYRELWTLIHEHPVSPESPDSTWHAAPAGKSPVPPACGRVR